MKQLAFLITLFPFLILSGKSEEESSFRFFQPLEGELRGKSVGRVPLSREIFAETNSSFVDLRLYHDGNEIPYLIQARLSPAKTSARKISAKVLEFEKSEEGSLVATIELDAEKEARQLRFQTELRNFEKNVRIEGSGDRESWELLVGEALIFDYARFIDFRKVVVDIPENSFRYFRITIEGATDRQQSLVSTLTRQVSESPEVTVEKTRNVTERDFRMNEISFFTENGEEEKDRSFQNHPLKYERDDTDQEKRSVFRIETNGLPLTALLFETEEVNFRRQVEVQIRFDTGEPEWRTIRSAEIFRYEIGDFQSERVRIPLPGNLEGTRSDEMRLVIFQGDNRPVVPLGFQGESKIHDLYFLSPESGEVTLAFGSDGNQIERPSYDTAAIQMGLQRKMAFTEFKGGEIVENPDFTPPKEPIQWDDQKWILWVIIGVVVAFLTWILFGSAREMDEAYSE
ncbi:MAG: DUF3999 family protein [Verrucomicrobiota bacterium]